MFLVCPLFSQQYKFSTSTDTWRMPITCLGTRSTLVACGDSGQLINSMHYSLPVQASLQATSIVTSL